MTQTETLTTHTSASEIRYVFEAKDGARVEMTIPVDTEKAAEEKKKREQRKFEDRLFAEIQRKFVLSYLKGIL